jgi:hypothetical protein
MSRGGQNPPDPTNPSQFALSRADPGGFYAFFHGFGFKITKPGRVGSGLGFNKNFRAGTRPAPNIPADIYLLKKKPLELHMLHFKPQPPSLPQTSRLRVSLTHCPDPQYLTHCPSATVEQSLDLSLSVTVTEALISLLSVTVSISLSRSLTLIRDSRRSLGFSIPHYLSLSLTNTEARLLRSETTNPNGPGSEDGLG